MFRRFKNDPKNEEEIKEQISKEIESSDIIAIVIAAIQVILPLAIGIVVMYYLVILFLTKVWL